MSFRLIVLLLNIIILASCSSLRAGIYLVSIDDRNGETILQNEPDVKIFLEHVVNSHENYSIKVFARTAVNFQFKRTKLLTHSFYLISSSDEEFHTLSFYGTEMSFYSKGAWALDSRSDSSSYIMYREGNNLWDVDEIFPEKIIDTKKTAANIVNRMDSGIRYYYQDHIRNRPNVDNCNTALYETIVFKTKP
ncbi:MAG: hypothetical protein LBD18_05145 [Treponema sp.]|nr:hypothetical protein [Treponema sp.]